MNRLENFVKKMADIGNIKERYKNIMLSPENLQYYVIAFVHKSFNRYNNYEIFEQLGDLSVNKFVVWHGYRKFPQINFSEGPSIAARLKITFGSKYKLGCIGKQLNFDDLILTNNQNIEGIRVPAIEDLIEDTFEAFMGATEYIFDKCLMKHTGYSFVYKILEGIFNNPLYVKDFKIEFSILLDPISTLKELTESPAFYEIFPPKHKLVYTDVKQFDNKTLTTVFLKMENGKKIELGKGVGTTKKKAKPIASKNALDNIEKIYFLKPKDKFEQLLKVHEEYPSHFVII
jgi:dsRNA-specific ribonuclease